MIMMLLVVHLIIGHRRLRDVEYYRDDEMVEWVLGLKRLPDVPAVSRSLASADEQSVGKVRSESRRLAMERLVVEGLSRVALDDDGAVLSTGRHAEGTAVGFNKKKKGARSYYPPLLHHRPRPTGSSMSTIAPVTSRTPTGPTPSSATVSAMCARAFPTQRQRPASTAHFSTKPSMNDCIRRGSNSPSRFLSNALPPSRNWSKAESDGDACSWARLLRDPLEAEVVERPLSLHLHQKAGQMPTQAADPTRPLSTHRIRVRIQGHRHQSTNEPTQGTKAAVRRRVSSPNSRRIRLTHTCGSSCNNRVDTCGVRARNLSS